MHPMPNDLIQPSHKAYFTCKTKEVSMNYNLSKILTIKI